ncbi:uncharacterized protein Dwil_GK23806, isoform A [Drosophila willistoni]|uniref:Uncharacterized protein, isoform A n=1 Tax=Drosophila willistoni TaxID=7260 RepID=B4MTM1_DROWI|nr:uncharacterized protein LOC6641697 isoform X1 [Drosophila willistoni]EDW75460.1 uncharacterized protein Dwil_GK23806, isoform A [Drosophila willistoni]
MDVWGFCVSDSTLSYGGSMRGGYYRDFEQFPYGTLEPSTTPFVVKDSYSRVQEKCKQLKTEKQIRKDCPFCKEHKKRPLVNYMRKREQRKHHDSICEDDEELHHEHEHEHDQAAAVPQQLASVMHQSCKV